MGAPQSPMAAASTIAGWRLGQHDQLMAWVREQAAELAQPREYSARDQVARDLRVLFIALMPYEFARFKTEVVQLLSEFAGFQTETIQSFKTRMIFAKLKITEMDVDVLDQICEYLGLKPESSKIEQIDKLVNLLARPENLGLNEEKMELLLYLSRVENVKIPGSRRHLSILKYSARFRANSASNTPNRSLPDAEPTSENDGNDTSNNADDGNDNVATRRKTKRRRKSDKIEEDSTQRKKTKRDSNEEDGNVSKRDSNKEDGNVSMNDAHSNGDDSKHESEASSKSEAKTKKQLRKTIRSYLEKSDVDVTMRMVKEHLLEHFGNDVLQSYKPFIKNTVMEIIERL